VKAIAALALTLAACAPRETTPTIDPRLAAQVPADASAIVGFRPAALGGIAAPFGDARYVLAAVRGAEVISAVLAADGSVSGSAKTTAGPVSPLVADGELLAARYPAWAVIRGGTALPLKGNLANLNNLLVDADLVTVGVKSGDGFAVELTASCPSEQRAQRFEGSLRAVLLLIKAGPAGQVRRDGRKVQASMNVPADVIGKLVR
jgi:hypothetical protein